jgi:hypothetical protein
MSRPLHKRAALQAAARPEDLPPASEAIVRQQLHTRLTFQVMQNSTMDLATYNVSIGPHGPPPFTPTPITREVEAAQRRRKFASF